MMKIAKNKHLHLENNFTKTIEVSKNIEKAIVYIAVMVGWLVVLGLTAL